MIERDILQGYNVWQVLHVYIPEPSIVARQMRYESYTWRHLVHERSQTRAENLTDTQLVLGPVWEYEHCGWMLVYGNAMYWRSFSMAECYVK
jgi:hypothetical protein